MGDQLVLIQGNFGGCFVSEIDCDKDGRQRIWWSRDRQMALTFTMREAELFFKRFPNMGKIGSGLLDYTLVPAPSLFWRILSNIKRRWYHG
jgi:hypothetical protein